MSAHLSTHHAIATLRHEGRLVRAAPANAHPRPVDGGRPYGRVRGLVQLLETARAHLGAQRGVAATGAPRFLS